MSRSFTAMLLRTVSPHAIQLGRNHYWAQRRG